MPLSIRLATLDDADLLVRIVDLASDGVLPMIWAGLAPEGISGADVGRALVTAESGQFSYRSAHLAQVDGEVVAGMIGYRLPTTPAEDDPDIPAVFKPVQDLENLALGRWYINVIATLPECQGRGYGAALLSRAREMAKDQGCPGLALIVAASNVGAVRFYSRHGFAEAARAPFDVSGYGHEPTEAILLIGDV